MLLSFALIFVYTLWDKICVLVLVLVLAVCAQVLVLMAIVYTADADETKRSCLVELVV